MSATKTTQLTLTALEAREVPAPLAFGWHPGGLPSFPIAPGVPAVSERGACPSDPVAPAKLGYVGAVPSDPAAPARGAPAALPAVQFPAVQRPAGFVSPLVRPGVAAAPSDPFSGGKVAAPAGAISILFPVFVVTGEKTPARGGPPVGPPRPAIGPVGDAVTQPAEFADVAAPIRVGR